MPIPVSCPSCSARINAPDSAAGKRAKCPKCGGVIPIPADQPEVVEDDFEVVDEPAPKKKSRPVVDDEDDDRPRKKSSKRAVASDDEDDDRPKKKSRRPADDDEDDDRPRKKGKSKKSGGGVPAGALIGGGIVLLLLVGCGLYFALSGGKGGSAGGGGGGSTKSGITWVPFNAPDGSFAAAFPDGAPTTETMESLARASGEKASTPDEIAQAENGMKALGIRMDGWSRTRTDRKYIIMVMSFPAAMAQQMNVETISKQMVEKGGDKIVSQTDFTAGPIRGKEILSQDQKTKKWTFGRIGIVGGNVVFTLAQSETELKADDADIKQFFEKFQWKK